jgi:hypothetical protein
VGLTIVMLSGAVADEATQTGAGRKLRVMLHGHSLMNMALLPLLAAALLALQSRFRAQYAPALARALFWSFAATLAALLVLGAVVSYQADTAIARLAGAPHATMQPFHPLVGAANRWAGNLLVSTALAQILLSLGSLFYRALSKSPANAA